MADLKITQLVDGGAPQATDEFVIARAGDNFKVDYAALEAAGLAGAVILAPASSARNVIQPTAGAVIAAIVKAHAAQSVDIFQIQKSDGSNYLRVGASGALGLGAGTYNPALYGGFQTQVVLSRAVDGYFEPLAVGPAFVPAPGQAATQLFLDGQITPAVDLTNEQNYGFGGSLRITGNKNFGAVRGYFYEAVHAGTKAAASGAQGYLIAGMQSAYSLAASTGDLSLIRGGWSIATHEGSGSIIDLIGKQAAAELLSTAPISGVMIGNEIEAIVYAASGTAVPVLTGMRVAAHSDGGRAVTTAKGIDILNIGRAGAVTSYGLYMAAQSGATNVFGIYVAGGKSVFVDSLITGKIALPADADFANGQGAWWWDQANSLPKWKGKTSAGVVVNATPYVEGGTDVAVADGGTGASTAAGARTNLDVPSNAEAILDAIVDAKGDLIVATAADTVARKAVGVEGAGLVADPAQSDGMEWRSGTARLRDFRVALGLLTENWDIGAAVNAATLTAGRIDGGGVYLYAGEVVTNIIVCQTVAAAGTAPTLIKLGLWSSAATPVCVAATADLKSDAMWLSTGYKVAALSSPYTVPTSGIYYAGMLLVGSFGTTAMQFIRNQNSLISIRAIGAFKNRNACVKAVATDMVVTDTGGYTTAGGWWFGVS